jgi:hypothetical protein
MKQDPVNQQTNSKEERVERLKPYRFQKGKSGNPKGRPKSITISEAYRQSLSKLVPNDPEGRTFTQKIADLMVQRASTGDVQAAKEITDRIEGKARQAIDVDMKVTSWREYARAHGLNEADVINEARQLIAESFTDGSDEESN